MRKKDVDPLVELRRYRDAVAKKFNYDGDAIAAYLRSIPPLPGMKCAKPPDEKEPPRAKRGSTGRNAAAKPKKAAARKSATSRKKSSAHA